MADAATKHPLSFSGGAIISDLKSISNLLRTRRSVAFAYGLIFAFVVFTVFLAFSPSSNSYSPWFTNIFSTSNTATPKPTPSADSYGSQFSSIFSYFYPNNNTSSPASPPQQQQQPHVSPLLPAQNTTTRSNTAASSQSPDKTSGVKNPPSVQDHTLKSGVEDPVRSIVSQPNQSTNASIVNKQPELTSKHTPNTQNSSKDQALKPNQTTIVPSQAPLVKKQTSSLNSTTETVSSGKEDSGNQTKGSAVKVAASNYTPSQLKKPSNGTKQVNGTNSGMLGKLGMENLVQNLIGCDLFDGEWVRDDSYPLYEPGSCSLIDEQFNCIINGRPDKDYQKYKWKPKRCILPRLNAGHMLDWLRGKRLVFVGDSLNRNMWESLVCILKGAVKDQSNVFEANGRTHFRGEASYSFIFKDYSCTIEFFVAPFLVREWEMTDKNGSKKETLRLDLVGRSSDQYKDADIIVFNTGHWWTHDKTSRGKGYYQEGSHVYDELNVLEAFRKALTTWARWVDKNINRMKSMVLFRGYSETHFSGGQWNSGGACDSEVEPIKNATYLRPYLRKMLVLEKVLRGMKTHVRYLNVTQMTDYRKDGHPSIYRKQHLSAEERRSPLHYQDCSHWCLPGVPDVWNEMLYAELLINEKQKQQVQKKHA